MRFVNGLEQGKLSKSATGNDIFRRLGIFGSFVSADHLSSLPVVHLQALLLVEQQIVVDINFGLRLITFPIL